MLVVVGGHSRNIGKTSVMAELIRAVPEARWTAVKITQYGHGVCSQAGAPCECAAAEQHPYTLTEEREPNASDSGRFLAAGAVRSFWLRTETGQLGYAVGAIRDILASSENAIFESNSVLRFFRPDLYVVVVDYSVSDIKDSLRRNLDRADVLVRVGDRAPDAAWSRVPSRWLEGKPNFAVRPPDYASPELAALVRGRISPVTDG